ncbi:phosphonomutase [Nocardia donostiensis]|uniref:isocitrate lyase/PEP mutase family protein n=1 Tax=Nocardia donostiensis TaxID=1538463 RepID=UPI0009D93E7B|nr:isocitrate lyase/phosphoenolpyruvate mutase family protein [Nocardia donostiensis]OQS14496.1 phosphonomutase [Nocardia donostiensis]
MTSLESRAKVLLELHTPGDPVVLPTVWDAWSAQQAVAAGFAALTVGSHPVADSIGRSDNEGMTFEELLTRVRQITDAVDVPVSVDIESGYGLQPAQLVDGLFEVGGAGLNIEDTVHSENRRLRGAQEHADFVHGLRQYADAAGVHLVINARTDLFLRREGEDSDRVDRAIERLKLAAAAGADVLYPVGRHSEAVMRRLTSELPLPVNAIALPDALDVPGKAELAAQGVARISFGPYLQAALTAQLTRILAPWS